ncbi:hypothetical protein [Xanthobacter sp. KR7-225]
METLSLLRGALSAQASKAIMAWARDNREAIAAERNRINPRFPIA